MQVVHVAERSGQVLFDEPLRPAEALEADLDEDPRRILDVVARCLHQARHLVQLRQDATRALGQRRVVEQRLSGKAGRDQVAVVLGIALPRTDGLQLEQAGADVGLERRPLEPLRVGQPRGIDRRQPARESAELPDLASIAARLRSSSRSS